MPHECTTCGRTFEDGSKEMLSGCPDCGGNKFQYHPGGVSGGSSGEDSAPDRSTNSSFEFGSGPGSPTEDDPASAPDPSPATGDSPSGAATEGTAPGGSPVADDVDSSEDRAQASARSTVVSEEELSGADADSPASGGDDSAGTPAAPEDGPTGDADGPETAEGADSPGLSELREELNEQFESIKIHDRGEYELNLMELYDREEHIIALQEDGRYVIDVPSSWREENDAE